MSLLVSINPKGSLSVSVELRVPPLNFAETRAWNSARSESNPLGAAMLLLRLTAFSLVLNVDGSRNRPGSCRTGVYMSPCSFSLCLKFNMQFKIMHEV